MRRHPRLTSRIGLVFAGIVWMLAAPTFAPPTNRLARRTAKIPPPTIDEKAIFRALVWRMRFERALKPIAWLRGRPIFPVSGGANELTQLTKYGEPTDQSSFTTPSSFTPTGDMVFAYMIAKRLSSEGNISAPTLTGNSLTWTNRVDPPANPNSQFLFYAKAAGATNGQLQISFGTQTIVDFAIIVFQPAVSVVTTGTNGVDCFNQTEWIHSGDNGTTIIGNLHTFTDANNITVGCFAKGNNTADYSAGSGFTLLDQQNVGAAGNAACCVEWQVGFDWTSDCTWGTTASPNMIVFELRRAGTSAHVVHKKLLQVGNSGSGSSKTTGSFDMTAGTYTILAVLTKRASGTANLSSVTSTDSSTWGQIGALDITSGTARLHAWSAQPASSTAGVTVSLSTALSQTAWAWWVFEIQGVAASGTLVQSKTGQASSVTSLTVTFDNAISSPTNATVGIFGVSANNNLSVGTDFVFATSSTNPTLVPGAYIPDNNKPPGAGSAGRLACEFKPSGTDTTVDMSIAASSDAAGIVFELKAATAAPAVPMRGVNVSQAINRAGTY